MKVNVKKILAEIWIYVILLVWMVFAISLKKNYQMDEIYSYGLANNVGQTAIHPDFAPYTYENPADAFLEYMVVEDGEPFSIKNVWYNQERESSPPFYYLAVYLVCFWFKERFTRWSAATVNLVFIVLAMIMFRKILKHFNIKGKELNLYSIFFMISPAIINNVVLFRMYTMFLFEALFLTYLILHYHRKENWKFYVLMIVGSVLGVLTHYYMIFFVFFLSLIYGISLLLDKEWKKAGKYILSMGIAGALSYLIFPGMIHHLFVAGRGAEGIENLQGSLEAHLTQLGKYLSILNREFFGYRFKYFAILMILLVCIGLFIKRKVIKENHIASIDSNKIWDIILLVVPSILYIIMIAKVAPYSVDRYVMGTFGIIIIVFLLVIKNVLNLCLENKKIVKNVAMTALCLATLISINQEFHISYLYLGDEEFLNTMESYSDVDALCVTSEGWRISGNFNDMIKLNSLTFFRNEIDTLEQMENLKTKDEYILYVVDNDAETIINRIYEICPQINAYEEIGKADVAYIYHLYAE